jgi:hypothetical protein
MSRDNLCDKVNDGDIIFHDGERIQVFKANKKSKVERFAVLSDVGGHVWSMSADEFERQTGFERLNPGGTFKFKSNNWSGTFHGYVTMAKRRAKTVPVLFSGGELPVDKYRDISLVCFLDGDEASYKMLPDYGFEVDLEYAAIVPAQCGLVKTADITGFTKRDLIAYVIHVNGEGKLSRDPIMKKVAALEAKPWVPTSNTDYFLGVEDNLNTAGTLRKAAKGKYGRILYGLGKEGRNRAAKVLARLGEEPGRI